MQLTVTVEPSAASLPGWDELVIGDGTELPSHDLWLSAKLLHVFEVFGNKSPQHVLARANGTLVGGLATHRLDELVTDRLMRFEVYSRGWMCCHRGRRGPYESRTGALTMPSLDEEVRRQVVSRLFAEAEDIAQRNDGRRSFAVVWTVATHCFGMSCEIADIASSPGRTTSFWCHPRKAWTATSTRSPQAPQQGPPGTPQAEGGRGCHHRRAANAGPDQNRCAPCRKPPEQVRH